LLKKPNGSNRNTVSVEDVEEFVKGYLNSKVATDQADNLIISLFLCCMGSFFRFGGIKMTFPHV
jgi:hypothetical protein